mmetsp:Transcript_25155/g.63786  ORF Transcript_25155/g.63786 Transcript_25155/m.63786 type:complete len:151 (-) Transcript_25155:385-837(-)
MFQLLSETNTQTLECLFVSLPPSTTPTPVFPQEVGFGDSRWRVGVVGGPWLYVNDHGSRPVPRGGVIARRGKRLALPTVTSILAAALSPPLSLFPPPPALPTHRLTTSLQWPDASSNGYAFFHRVDKVNGGDANPTHTTGFGRAGAFWYK